MVEQSATTALSAATARRTPETAPRRRLVLLGASNVARGIATVVQSARAAFPGPFDLMAAVGHGRSYGRGSWVLGRWLPGIVESPLWDELAQRRAAERQSGESESAPGGPLPALALVTDVGNDILYGAANEQILGWVETCVDRLHEHDCRIAMTGIPVESLWRIGEWEFPLFRSMLYPGCFISRDEALHQAARLAESLKELARERGIDFIEPKAHWYGRDRIHIARRWQADAWRAFLSGLSERDAPTEPATWSEFIAIRRLVPHHRKIFGVTQRRQQPAGRLSDGTLVSMY